MFRAQIKFSELCTSRVERDQKRECKPMFKSTTRMPESVGFYRFRNGLRKERPVFPIRPSVDRFATNFPRVSTEAKPNVGLADEDLSARIDSRLNGSPFYRPEQISGIAVRRVASSGAYHSVPVDAASR